MTVTTDGATTSALSPMRTLLDRRATPNKAMNHGYHSFRYWQVTQINAKPRKSRSICEIIKVPFCEFPLHTTLKKAAGLPLLGGLRYLCATRRLVHTRFQIKPAFLVPEWRVLSETMRVDVEV